MVEKKDFDFSGWATRNDLRCSDGRTIKKNAFAHCDGMTVPLVYNHRHDDISEVLGHCLLENRDEGVYTYGYFNDTQRGQEAKQQVQHGDIVALSIYANQLKQNGMDVLHGAIREVSLVLAGANPGAYIDNVTFAHSADSPEEEAVVYTGELLDYVVLNHAEKSEEEEKPKMAEEAKKPEEKAGDDKTVQEVIDSMSEEQKTVMYALIGQALEENGAGEDDSEGGNDVKHNVFENDTETTVLCHADQEAILSMAKQSSCGSFQEALAQYAGEGTLSHGISDSDMEALFPEYKDVYPGAPELITKDQGWITKVMSGVHKSPISRVRTRQMDAKNLETELRALGYTKGEEKKLMANMKLLKRTTDPQTVYVKDKLERDDIIDITDFDVVDYQYKVMKMVLNEEIATAVMIGDGRDDGDESKISTDHIRPIWGDDPLYTIYADVDFDAEKAAIQGTDTSKNFGDNYIYAEAMIEAALYARETYKGSGNLTFYCTPHLLNQMLLARDLNGRRIYNSKADLAAALNVTSIETAEQFEGKTRTDGEGSAAKTKKLLGIFVNLDDYQIGATKGGEISKFEDFDIDFNQYKYLMETRCSGALTRVLSAICLEEDVTATNVAG